MTPRHTLAGLVLCLAALTILMACTGAGPPSPPPMAEPPPPPPPTYYVNISGLALRSAPSTTAPQISTLQFNDAVQLMGTSDGWGRVLDVRRNISGWASLRYLQPSPAYRPHPVPRHEPPVPRQPTPTPKPSETPPPKVM